MVNSPAGSHYRYVIRREDDFKKVRMSAGDHRVLKYMASKDQISMVHELHELFTAGLKCKGEEHIPRMRRFGFNV